MSLSGDLLAQARQLATLDPRRPRQANLRRAVSAAYYGLFHLLSAEAAGLYAADLGFLSRICRTHNHADMKKASSMLANNKLPKAIQPSSGYAAPPDLKLVATAFVTLQQARHGADYDLIRTFSRSEAITFVRLAEQASEAWGRIKRTDDARLYLACFLLWDRWDKDPR